MRSTSGAGRRKRQRLRARDRGRRGHRDVNDPNPASKPRHHRPGLQPRTRRPGQPAQLGFRPRACRSSSTRSCAPAATTAYGRSQERPPGRAAAEQPGDDLGRRRGNQPRRSARLGCLGYRRPEPCEGNRHTEPEAFLTLPTSCCRCPRATVTGESWPNAAARESRAPEIRSRRQASRKHAPARLPRRPAAIPARAPNPRMTQERKAQGNTPTGLTCTSTCPSRRPKNWPGRRGDSRTRPSNCPKASAQPLRGERPRSLPRGRTASAAPASRNSTAKANPAVKTPDVHRTLPNPLEPGKNFCPNGSKVGVVKIFSPGPAVQAG